ncbi:MAG: sigma 54-interacting transcriptional regulator [Myxococcota bacterium]
MRCIRSLLWIGPGEGLASSGISEAPSLDVTWVPSVEDAFALPPMSFDGIVIEGFGTHQLLQGLQQLGRRPACPPMLVCLSAEDHASIPDLLSAGARDVIVPGVEPEAPPLLEELLDRLTRLASSDGDTTRASTSSSSQAMQELEALVGRASQGTATVLIQGETGTGKEIIARQIHERGPRRKLPFVALNCAAFPETLLESELFGHRRGAFTGADRDKAGHLALAHRGTVFLDEVAETSPGLQAKLLRVLQEKEILPVGASRPQPIDVRVIAATNVSLMEQVAEGRFRQDLYYRLAVFPLEVPPLRERTADIQPLARHFLELHGDREKKPDCQLSLAATRLLESYRWPGNVRELENEIQRALTLAEPGEVIGPRLLSPRVVGLVEAVRHAPRSSETLRETLDSIEAWLIRRALSHNAGRRAATARKLGVTREG